MLVILALYAACFAVLWWGYFGYHIFLGLMSIINPQNPSSKTEVDREDLASLSILVPCYNEEAIIRDKVTFSVKANANGDESQRRSCRNVLIDSTAQVSASGMGMASIETYPP